MNIATTGRNALDPIYERFSCRVHPDVASVESAVRRWARDTGLVRAPELLDRFDRSGFGQLAARLYPLADDPRPPAKVLAWATVLDDVLDGGALCDPALPRDSALAELSSLFANGQSPDTWRGGVLPNALGDCWPELTAGMSSSWRGRLYGHLADSVRAGENWSDDRARRRPPTLADYVAQRRRDGIYLMSLELMEQALGLRIPDAMYCDVEFTQLRIAVIDNGVWIGDLASADRELAAGDVINLVAVLRAETGSLSAAVDRAIDMVARRTRELLDAERALRAHRVADWPWLDAWIDAANLMIRGNYEWVMRTPRHQRTHASPKLPVASTLEPSSGKPPNGLNAG